MNVCMLAYTFYEKDNRVRRYSETLARHGAHVDVVALRREDLPYYETLNGVHIYRIQKREINEKGRLSYLFKLVRFLIVSSYFISKKELKNSYDLIHIHNVPDFLVFAAWLPKLRGAKIVLDIHDIVPEFYSSKFNVKKDTITYKILVFLEKASILFSDHVIVSNHIWQETLISRSVKKDKCSVILNYPDPYIFYKRSREKNHDHFVFLYPGSLNWHQGLDVAIRAFAGIKDQIPGTEFHIYGSGSAKKSFQQLASELDLDKNVLFKGSLPMDEIADVMANADLGIVPKRATTFGNEAFSTKILEFMALGVPVLVSNTKIDKYYFNNSLVAFFNSEDVENLAEKMLLLIKNQEKRARLRMKGLEFIEENNWEVKKNIYFDMVNSLTGTNLP